jgi:hypothetical protein
MPSKNSSTKGFKKGKREKSDVPSVPYRRWKMKRFGYGKMESSDRVKSQKMAYPNYTHPGSSESELCVIQAPDIKITQHGIPPAGPEMFAKTDADRGFMKIPLDPKQPFVVDFIERVLKPLDDYMKSEKVKKEFFGKHYNDYDYIPVIREPREADPESDSDSDSDDDEKEKKKKKKDSKKKYDIVKCQFMKAKFDIDFDSKDMSTELYLPMKKLPDKPEEPSKDKFDDDDEYNEAKDNYEEDVADWIRMEKAFTTPRPEYEEEKYSDVKDWMKIHAEWRDYYPFKKKPEDIKTVTDMTKSVTLGTYVRTILLINKIWASKNKDQKTGRKDYGVGFKIWQIEAMPYAGHKSTHSHFKGKRGFVRESYSDSESESDDDVPIKKGGKKKKDTSDSESDNELDAAKDAGSDSDSGDESGSDSEDESSKKKKSKGKKSKDKKSKDKKSKDKKSKDKKKEEVKDDSDADDESGSDSESEKEEEPKPEPKKKSKDKGKKKGKGKGKGKGKDKEPVKEDSDSESEKEDSDKEEPPSDNSDSESGSESEAEVEKPAPKNKRGKKKSPEKKEKGKGKGKGKKKK